MNPVLQIAIDQLSVEELEKALSIKKEMRGNLEAMSEEDLYRNNFRKYLRTLKPAKK